MSNLPERDLKPTPEAEAIYRRWLALLNNEFTRHGSAERRSEIVRDELFQIYLGRPHGGRLNTTLDSELATNVAAETFDPRNVTLAPEYLAGCDAELYGPRKPLILFWQMFDRSSLGLNLWLGFRMRCMLGKHIFRHVGRGVRIFPQVSFTFGYNLTLEDECSIHQNVLLDDSGPLTVSQGTSVPASAVLRPQAAADASK